MTISCVFILFRLKTSLLNFWCIIFLWNSTFPTGFLQDLSAQTSWLRQWIIALTLIWKPGRVNFFAKFPYWGTTFTKKKLSDPECGPRDPECGPQQRSRGSQQLFQNSKIAKCSVNQTAAFKSAFWSNVSYILWRLHFRRNFEKLMFNTGNKQIGFLRFLQKANGVF